MSDVAKLGWTCAVLAAIGMFSILVQAATHTEIRVQTDLMPNVIIFYICMQYAAVCNTSCCNVCLRMSSDVKPSFKYDVVNSTHLRVRSLNNLSCRLIRDLLQAQLEDSICSRLVRMLTMLPMLLFHRLIFPPGAVFLVGSSVS